MTDSQVATTVNVVTVETPSLGDRSYVIHDGTAAAVVDPQRDIDRLIDAVDALGVRVTHVVETHLHNDYVTGGLALADRLGAAYLVPAGDEVAFDRTPVADGEEFAVGRLRMLARHTPGHTPNHMSYVVHDGEQPTAVLTGGSMLFGAVGRTDLIGREHTENLTRAQYRSVRRLAHELPGHVSVLPTHGFGSFCSATETSGDSSTIAAELGRNVALVTDDEDRFVAELTAGLTAYPRYYAHMATRNAAGPAAPDLGLPEPVDPQELHRRIAAGEWVVDLRERRAFARCHVTGTVGVELGDSFATHFGWVLPWQAPVTLIADRAEDLLEARRQLARIGFDAIAGAATGPVDALAAGRTSNFRVATFGDLAGAFAADGQLVLDVRRADEWHQGHLPGALHVPFWELPDRVHDLPEGTLWVHCASGYRASVAASLLDRAGRAAVLIDDDWQRASDQGLPIEQGLPIGRS